MLKQMTKCIHKLLKFNSGTIDRPETLIGLHVAIFKTRTYGNPTEVVIVELYKYLL